jgi:hypothetical protein
VNNTVIIEIANNGYIVRKQTPYLGRMVDNLVVFKDKESLLSFLKEQLPD